MTDTLILARKDAVARGDKALGRELYHQLIDQGYLPEEIDASTFTDDVPSPVSVVPNPEPEVLGPPSNDPTVVRLWEKRQALLGELGTVSHPKTGNPRRVGEVEAQIATVDADIATLLAPPAASDADKPDAPDTTEAPAAPEKAVKPAPKRRTAKDAE